MLGQKAPTDTQVELSPASPALVPTNPAPLSCPAPSSPNPKRVRFTYKAKATTRVSPPAKPVQVSSDSEILKQLETRVLSAIPRCECSTLKSNSYSTRASDVNPTANGKKRAAVAMVSTNASRDSHCRKLLEAKNRQEKTQTELRTLSRELAVIKLERNALQEQMQEKVEKAKLAVETSLLSAANQELATTVAKLTAQCDSQIKVI